MIFWTVKSPKLGLLATSLLLVCVQGGCSNAQVGSQVLEGGEQPPVPGNTYPPFGFTPFPYAFDAAAIERTYEIAKTEGGIYAIQRDNGIPWYEALNDLPYPRKVQDTWQDYVNRKPTNVPVYLALAPLGEDRETLIYGSEGSAKREFFVGRKLNDADVKTAYTKYVLKAVEIFNPDYLNIGVEVGELAHRKPRLWKQFEELYLHVAREVKAAHPDVMIGISFGLHSFLENGVVERSATLIENSDYVGFSFYPYMSPFHERFGAAPLPAPPQQWRAPLEKVRSLLNKPIAICETGYTSTPVTVPAHKLQFMGSETLQSQYVGELADFASRDGYLFVVWFMPVDYEKLFESIPKGDGTYLIWQNIGIFDKNLKKKPAWETWHSVQTGTRVSEIDGSHSNTDPMPVEVVPETSGGFQIRYTSINPVFQGSESDVISIRNADDALGNVSSDEQYLNWSYNYKIGRPQYMMCPVPENALSEPTKISFFLRSNREETVLLQVEEKRGEAFYAVLRPTTEWTRITLAFESFTPSPEKRQEGVLNTAAIAQILFADMGGSDGATGSRTVDIGAIRIY